VEAFEREAIDYLLKPVTDERLTKTIDRLKRNLNETAEPGAQLARLFADFAQRAAHPSVPGKAHLRWIRASRGQTTYQIPVEDVLYFQADEKYTIVMTSAGEHTIRTSLTELLAELDPDTFWQVHRSTLVNVNWIESSRRNAQGQMTLNLKQGAGEVSVSRAYMHLFKQM
jgi:DNA-binding LytR/AlgR family response regulator